LVVGPQVSGCGSNSNDSPDASTTGGALSTGGTGTPTTGGAASTGGVVSQTGGGTASTDGGSSFGGAAGFGGQGELDGYEVQVDPYGNCPLVAVVNLEGIEASEVNRLRVVVAGQNGAPDFEREYSAKDADFVAQLDTSDLTFSKPGYHVPVLGLYADTESSVRVVVDLVEGSNIALTLNIETHLTQADEDPWVPTIQVNTAMTDLMEPGWTVSEINREPNPGPPIVIVDWTRTIAFDEQGAIRWALRPDDLPQGETFTLTRSIDGNFLTGSLDTIVELTKLGRTIHSFQVSDYTLHHEILQIGSEDPTHASPGDSNEHLGNLLVLASKNGAPTIQDRILELDLETGEMLKAWDLGTVFDTTRTTYVDPEQWAPGVGDWLHANGLAYSKEDESIIVSGRHQGVAKVRRDGSLVWLLAPHKGWEEPQSLKLLTAVDGTLTPYEEAVQLGDQPAGSSSNPEFGWIFGQHSPALLPNGDLLVFDNGSSRHFGAICGSFSRAVIYRVDEIEMTVRQMGQFIFTRAESSCFVSNTHLLPVTGNIFIQPGSAFFDVGSSTAVVREVATQFAEDGTATFGTVVFDATVDMSVIESGSFAYSYRGHRWTF